MTMDEFLKLEYGSVVLVMTMDEFLKLEYGSVVISKSNPEEEYEIIDTGRTTHIVRDKQTGEIRLLTPVEMERIQGFPSNWTKECLVDGEKVEMPVNKRKFMMGNALVVNLVRQMEPVISKIIENED